MKNQCRIVIVPIGTSFQEQELAAFNASTNKLHSGPLLKRNLIPKAGTARNLDLILQFCIESSENSARVVQQETLDHMRCTYMDMAGLTGGRRTN